MKKCFKYDNISDSEDKQNYCNPPPSSPVRSHPYKRKSSASAPVTTLPVLEKTLQDIHIQEKGEKSKNSLNKGTQESDLIQQLKDKCTKLSQEVKKDDSAVEFNLDKESQKEHISQRQLKVLNELQAYKKQLKEIENAKWQRGINKIRNKTTNPVVSSELKPFILKRLDVEAILIGQNRNYHKQFTQVVNLPEFQFIKEYCVESNLPPASVGAQNYPIVTFNIEELQVDKPILRASPAILSHHPKTNREIKINDYLEQYKHIIRDQLSDEREDATTTFLSEEGIKIQEQEKEQYENIISKRVDNNGIPGYRRKIENDRLLLRRELQHQLNIPDQLIEIGVTAPTETDEIVLLRETFSPSSSRSRSDTPLSFVNPPSDSDDSSYIPSPSYSPDPNISPEHSDIEEIDIDDDERLF